MFLKHKTQAFLFLLHALPVSSHFASKEDLLYSSSIFSSKKALNPKGLGYTPLEELIQRRLKAKKLTNSKRKFGQKFLISCLEHCK